MEMGVEAGNFVSLVAASLRKFCLKASVSL